MSAEQEAEAWKTLINVLPTILSAKDCDDHIKSNFEGIDQACKDVGQTPHAVFGRLKRMSSAIVRQAKVRNNVDGSSSDSDDDQPLEFTKKAVKPVKGKKSCNNCGGPISSKSKGLCRDCHNNRGILTISKKGKSDICVQCLEDRVIVQDGLCKECYGEENQGNEPIEEKSTEEQAPIPAKVVKKSTTSTVKRNRKTAKCMDCQAPVRPKTKRCMDCHKAFLKIKPTDTGAKKDKVKNTPVEPASLKLSVKKENTEDGPEKLSLSKPSVKKESVGDGLASSGNLKITLKRSTIDAGLKSKESSKKSRIADY